MHNFRLYNISVTMESAYSICMKCYVPALICNLINSVGTHAGCLCKQNLPAKQDYGQFKIMSPLIN